MKGRKLPSPGPGDAAGHRGVEDAHHDQGHGEHPRIARSHKLAAHESGKHKKAQTWSVNPSSRSGDGSSTSFSSPASIKWIGTTISVVTSIICPGRSAPQRRSPIPSAANIKVPTMASPHLPRGDQSRSPRSNCRPTVELTTISKTARQRMSFCQCSSKNSPAMLDHDKGAAQSDAGRGGFDRAGCPGHECFRAVEADQISGLAARPDGLFPLQPHRVSRLNAEEMLVVLKGPVKVSLPLAAERRHRQGIDMVGPQLQDLAAKGDRFLIALVFALPAGELDPLGNECFNLLVLGSALALGIPLDELAAQRLEPCTHLGERLRCLGAEGHGKVVVLCAHSRLTSSSQALAPIGIDSPRFTGPLARFGRLPGGCAFPGLGQGRPVRAESVECMPPGLGFGHDLGQRCR